jgi:cation diffusion facilitator CzcD-associated flavoprotein CzcO
MNLHATMDQDLPFDAIIVGSGFSGLCIAIKMQQAGLRYVVLEQAGNLGGTWRDNTYPGAACDVPSNLYCFSFAPNPNWSRTYPQQAEIETYMNQCADDFGVRQSMQFKQCVSSARFDQQKRLWCVETTAGEKKYFARSLILATGGLSRPKMPMIEGLESFKGEVFHTARWRHDLSLVGKRVGIIGTGASAIQVVPAIAGQVETLSIFQRTPPWIIFKPDFAISAWHRWLRRKLPFMQKLNRAFIYSWHESWAIAFTRIPSILKWVQQLAKGFLRFHIHDAQLRKALTPNYVIGCKRVLLTNHYLPALQGKNVSVNTQAIKRIHERAIVTADGVEHALDIIIACTGFQAAEAGAPFPIYGLNALELNAHWQSEGGASAYLGITVSGFPNFFIMTGPNTALGHNSMVYMIESQANYVMSGLQHIHKTALSAFDIPKQTQTNYNVALQKQLASTVWNIGGCSSWYLASNGLNTTLWPDFTFIYRRKTKRFDVEHYRNLDEKTQSEN